MVRKHINILIYGSDSFLAKGVKDLITHAYIDSKNIINFHTTLAARYICDLIIYLIPSDQQSELALSRFNNIVLDKTIYIASGTKNSRTKNENLNKSITYSAGCMSDVVHKVKNFLDTMSEIEYKNILTKRELTILSLLSKGFSPTQVGKLLNTNDNTVYTHNLNSMHKLNFKTSADFKLWLASEYQESTNLSK